jgi:Bax protein
VSAPETVIAESGLTDRKQAFINELLPYIEQENRRLRVMRNNVEQIFARLDARVALDKYETQQISRLADKYRLNGDPLQDKNARTELLRKIDIIPASMALAQAANESAWGESRFAREANNLFGIWTYDEEKGLKPLDREEGKTHLVRIFDDFGESVSYYMHTLNSHPAYAELRDIRQQLRERNQVIDGHKLAAGLEQYSARGQQYIDLIQSLIRQNEWAQLDSGNQQT